MSFGSAWRAWAGAAAVALGAALGPAGLNQHLAVFPTAALAVTVLATTLFGDGLRDALDPTLKGT